MDEADKSRVSIKSDNAPKYRADIDGMRAVAVLSVLLFHADLGSCSGGYVGVDVFFVISGYLITGLILKEVEADRFQILEFLERRVRRILPALFVVVLLTIVAGWFLFLPQDFRELGQSVFAQSLLVSNVYFWRESGYFDQAAEMKPLLHTWSLAIEEQFYLFFPILLITVNRLSRKFIVPAILVLFAFSLSACVYCSYWHVAANFYLLPTRAWELLLGAFLAAIPAQRVFKRCESELMCWGGILAILYGVFFYDPATRFPGVAALLPCGGAALIIWANSHTLTSVGKLLAASPVVFLGRTSYSLYLWHWPVLVFGKYWAINPLTSGQRILLLIASVVLASLSWRFVEAPFRKRELLRTRTQALTYATIITGLLLIAGITLHMRNGLPTRIPAAAVRYADAINEIGGGKNVTLKEAQNGNFIELGNAGKHLPINLLVWGDSHAGTLKPVMDHLCKEHAIRGVLATHSSTPPLVNVKVHTDRYIVEDSIAYQNAIVDFIRSKRVANVVLVAAWGRYLGPMSADELNRGLANTLGALDGTDASIWIMKQVPEYPWPVPKALAKAVIGGRSPEALGLTVENYRLQLQRQSPIFSGLELAYPRLKILDPSDLFRSENFRCRLEANGKSLYTDNHHLSITGAMILRPMFGRIFD